MAGGGNHIREQLFSNENIPTLQSSFDTVSGFVPLILYI